MTRSDALYPPWERAQDAEELYLAKTLGHRQAEKVKVGRTGAVILDVPNGTSSSVSLMIRVNSAMQLFIVIVRARIASAGNPI